MSKEVFERIVGVAKGNGMDNRDMSSLLSFLQDLGFSNVARIFRSKEMRTLLMSNEMKDAVDAANLSKVSNLYEKVIEGMRIETNEYIGEWIRLFFYYGTPLVILMGAFGYFAYTILKSYREREFRKEDKKVLRQLKRQNQEAQRRLKTNPELKKKAS